MPLITLTMHLRLLVLVINPNKQEKQAEMTDDITARQTIVSRTQMQ